MRKIYIVFFTILSLTRLSAAEDLITSFTLYDLTLTRMNSNYTDNQGNIITLKTNEPSSDSFNYLSDVDNPLICANEAAPTVPPINDKYTKIVLKGISNSTPPANSPYFIIGFDDESTIKEINFLGYGGSSNPQGGSEFLYAFSSTGTNEGDFFLPDSEDPWDETGWLYFKNQTCNYENVKITIPEGTKYIKCIATYTYLHWTTSISTPTIIQAIRFFAEEKTATAIETQEKEKTEYTLEHKDEIISANQLSDIIIYNMAGQKVMQVKNTKQIGLDNLNKGIYIIKAVSKINGHVFVKKISLV